LTIVKLDVKSRLCGRDWEEKKREESRNATQVLAKIQKREARATRSIARARESYSSAFWIRSIAPLDSPRTFDSNRGTEQCRRANGCRL